MLNFTVSPHGEHYLHDLQRGDLVDRPSADVFDDHFSTDFDADDTLFVLVGSDSGLLVRWLARRGLGNGSRALFVELDEYHELILSEVQSLLQEGELEMCTDTDTSGVLSTGAIDRWLYGGKVVLVESMGCYLGRSDRYTALARTLRTLLDERTHRAGVQLNWQMFMQVGIRNLTENRVPASSIGHIGEGRTAIVLGGGPSLDLHLDWVRAHREQLFVLAVSRVVDRLSAASITPDVVVAVDPQDLLYDISKRALDLKGVLLVGSYHVAAPLLQQWPGPHVYTGHAVPWESEFMGDTGNQESPGSTVTHMATWVAYSWGFSQILLSGFDLCYAPGGASHASGSLESLCADLPFNYTAQVMTYSGRRAGTAMALKVGRDELELMGEHMQRSGTAVFNLAPEAAWVDSIPHRQTEHIVLERERPALDLKSDLQADKAHWLALKKELAEVNRGLRALRTACTKADALFDGLHGTGSRGKDPRCKHRLDVLERRLNGRDKRWTDMAKGYAALELMSTIAPRGFEVQSDEELERWGRNYYRIIRRAADTLLTCIAQARERVDCRLDECDGRPNVAALLSYWEKDGTPGRLRFALGGTVLDGTIAGRVAEAESRFAAHLADTDTRYSRVIKRNKANSASMLRIVILLFNERERNDLAHLAQAFDHRGEEYSVLANWAFGQLAELDGDPQAAIDCYVRIIDHHASLQEGRQPVPEGQESLLESALLRIAELQLGSEHPDQALETLTLLTELSVAHAPRLARMLALLGRHDEAIALLHAMLDRGAGDWRVAALLGEMYERSGSQESAAVAHALSRRMRGQARGDAPQMAHAA